MSEAKRMLEKAVAMPGLGAETKLGQAILKSLEAIGRELPEGTVTPGMQTAGMEQYMLQRRQNNPMDNIIAALGAGGGGAAAGGGAGGAAQPAPPRPMPAM